MKQLISICAVVVFICTMSCGPLYNPNSLPNYKPNTNYYEVVTVPIAIENDTAFVNEIRFFNIDSALECQAHALSSFWTMEF